MKIATWNLERLKGRQKRLPSILRVLNELAADILVLTETSTDIQLEGFLEVVHSTFSTDLTYAKHERRVSIFSKFPVLGHLQTWDSATSICPVLQTPLGELAVYGTIIGTDGRTQPNFEHQLVTQLHDLQRIGQGHSLCVAGDFNLSIGDNYYVTLRHRERLLTMCEKLKLEIVTAALPQNIDHIALPGHWLVDKSFTIGTWNEDKLLSDHKGIWAELAV